VKKLFSVLVMAGFLAGLGCGSETTAKDKDKKGGTTTGTTGKDAAKDSSKPDTRKDL
jgi:hypothetical protein